MIELGIEEATASLVTVHISFSSIYVLHIDV